ncbi:WHG domain-containing protein [Paracoccus sp. (in: a-proteobacteria)]|uniref:WHG domain-containing protein n=1 Tax=Paracoccus sp. TaxID=267 RepID=UPI0035B31A68
MSTALQPGQHLLSAALAVATRIAAETGEPPRLKTVAKALAVKPRAVKEVIPDRKHLLSIMAENAQRLLLHMATQRVAAVSCRCPINQFEALADAYIEWACDYPYEFHLIGAMSTGQLEAHPNLVRYRQSLHEVMYRILQRAKDEGLLASEDDPILLIAMSHTYAYGVISKMFTGDLARWNLGPSDREAARHALRLFMDKCFRHQPLNARAA